MKQVHEQHTCSARGGGQTAEVLVREVLHRWKEKEGRLLRLREAGQGCPSPGAPVADEAAQKIHKLTYEQKCDALFTADQMQSAVSADPLYPFVPDVSICRERFTWSAALVRLLVLPMPMT